MAPTDSLFLLGESREHPMHVGGLALFAPPDGGASAADLREMFETALTGDRVASLFRKRARRSVTSLGQWGWDTLADHEVDLGHHVRRDALPRPGGMDELMALVSRLHGTLLDRSRPPVGDASDRGGARPTAAMRSTPRSTTPSPTVPPR